MIVLKRTATMHVLDSRLAHTAKNMISGFNAAFIQSRIRRLTISMPEEKL